jgi:hypothetical protein
MASCSPCQSSRTCPTSARPAERGLTSGLKDEAAARYLGLSLRTVRRRIAALMDRTGANTRFQAG